jgi:diketogulonate reductase-like aldo/keto reductase
MRSECNRSTPSANVARFDSKRVATRAVPFGGSGAPLLRDRSIAQVATVVAESAGRPVTAAQLLVYFVKDVMAAVAIPRSTKMERQVENVALDGIADAVNEEMMAAIAAMDDDVHYDWDPNGVP